MALGFFEFDDLRWIFVLNGYPSVYALEYGLRGLADRVPVRWDGKPIRWCKLKKKISLDHEEGAIDEVKCWLSGKMDFFLGEKNLKVVLAQGSLFANSSSVVELQRMYARSAILKLLLDGVSPDSPTFKAKVAAASCLSLRDRKDLRSGFPAYLSLLSSREL